MGGPVLAPAKVNLFLHVGAPDASGYHPLCSLMVFADIGDHLRMFSAEAPELRIEGPFSDGLTADASNLVARAAQALAAEARRPLRPLGLVLDKQLPVASGLGGGSSDAGAAFRLLREAHGLDLTDARLEQLAAELGADGPACLWGRPVVAEGRGERLSSPPGLPAIHAVLVNPRIPVSTAQVYGRFDALGAFGSVSPPTAPPVFESSAELAAWLSLQRNDLQAASIAVEPRVGDVIDILSGEPETLLARVSGSGGSCFALCAGDVEAQSLAERIAAIEPRWWVRCCRLGGPWF